jgi:predicted TIM-barrel fold metal-dependent hydrolase
MEENGAAGRQKPTLKHVKQVAAATGRNSMTNESAPLSVIDFHNHYIGPSFRMTAQDRIKDPAERALRARVDALLESPAALMGSFEETGVSARVINIPTAFLEDADGNLPLDIHRRINDEVATLVTKNPDRLLGLASIDAFSGDAGAHEVQRAYKDLDLRGIFIESASGDLLLDAPQARPTLAAAEDLGIPVFVHPQTDPQLHARFAHRGRLGHRHARATVNAATLLAMLDTGVFDELPKLQVVVTTLAIGGVLMAGGFGDGHGIRSDTPALMRRHVYIDTMGLHPALVGAVVGLLGADHVLAGTDWPINIEKDVPVRLKQALDAAGLDAAQQQLVARGNTLRLLGAA